MNKIEKSIYQGYMWWSHKNTPEVYKDKEIEIELDDSTNPFVVEGLLYDGKVSYTIKYVDGKHIVTKFVKSELVGIEKTEEIYLANFKGVAGLKFNQYWRPQVDELCEGMEVLQPAELVFVGFNNKEE